MFGTFCSPQLWWQKPHFKNLFEDADYFQSLGSSMNSLSDTWAIWEVQENNYETTKFFNYSVISSSEGCVPHVLEGASGHWGKALKTQERGRAISFLIWALPWGVASGKQASVQISS